MKDNELMLQRIKEALQQSDWKIRAEAVKRLPLLGEVVPLSLIIDAMTDPHRAVRVAAVEVCAELAYRIPVAVVEAALADDHWSVRAAAAWALGHFGESAPGPLLLALIDDKEESDLVRASALHALGTLDDTTHGEHIIAALGDTSSHVREVAALVLGNRREKAAIPALTYVLTHDEDEFVRATAAEALGQMEDAIPETALLAACSDDGRQVAVAAAHALGMMRWEALEEDRGEREEYFPYYKSSRVDSARSSAYEQRMPHKQLRFSDLSFLSIMILALVSGWIPSALRKPLAEGKLTYPDLTKYFEQLIRTEYIRALLISRQVVIHLACLWSQPAIFKDYMVDQPARDAFKRLLDTGVIVPLLLHETTPEETPPDDASAPAFALWKAVCRQVRVHYLRFDGDDESRQELAQKNFAHILTPQGSQLEHELQVWPQGVSEQHMLPEITSQQLISLLDPDVCPPQSVALCPISLGCLQLEDVLVLRATEEWIIYIECLETLLQYPFDFALYAPKLYTASLHYARSASRLLQQKHPQRQLTTLCKPVAELSISIGGALLVIIWTKEGPIYMKAHEERLQMLEGHEANVSVQFCIREWSNASEKEKFFTGIEFIHGRTTMARQQWKALLIHLAHTQAFREVKGEDIRQRAIFNQP